MKDRKGFTLIELLVVIAIIAVLAAILFPVFAKARRAAQASTCESNMKQIGNAIKMYMTDWEDTFPTNHSFKSKAYPTGQIKQRIILAKADLDDNDQPLKSTEGIAWVEALYNYVEQVTKQKDPMSAWRCPAAKNGTLSDERDPLTAVVTYSFNINLCEMPEGIVKNSANLMMCRELDRLYNSECRPKNICMTSPVIPDCPFVDSMLIGSADDAKPDIHGTGSHILFADGHVKSFDWKQFFPVVFTLSDNWDYDTNQWYNYVYNPPTTEIEKKRNKSIAISP